MRVRLDTITGAGDVPTPSTCASAVVLEVGYGQADAAEAAAARSAASDLIPHYYEEPFITSILSNSACH